MTMYRLKSARMTDATPGNTIDNAVGELEGQLAGLFGVTIDVDHDGAVSYSKSDADTLLAAKEATANKGAANGYASLNANTALSESKELDIAPGAGASDGVKEIGTAGETVAFGDLVYLKAADARWWKAKADASATSAGVDVCLVTTPAGATAGNPVGLLDIGYIQNSGWSWTTVGAPLYASAATGGALTQTAPTGTGKIVRIVGYVSAATVVKFKPDNAWVELV